MFLLDTNVISETRRRTPAPRVVAWLGRADPAALFISVLTLGEIAKGVASLARRDPEAAAPVGEWFAGIRRHFADRLVGIDPAIAEEWGRLSAARPLPVIDGLLAATARVRGLTLVTRNVDDVAGTGAPTLNPWSD